MTPNNKISRELLVSETISSMLNDCPKLINRTAIHSVLKARFPRINQDIYPMFDAFVYVIIDMVSKQIENDGIRQPSAEDFLRSFRNIENMNLAIGQLRIENSVPTEEYSLALKNQIIMELKPELDKLCDSRIGAIRIALTHKNKSEEKEEITEPDKTNTKSDELELELELESEFKKYQDIIKNDG